jgi:hypothetical protein
VIGTNIQLVRSSDVSCLLNGSQPQARARGRPCGADQKRIHGSMNSADEPNYSRLAHMSRNGTRTQEGVPAKIIERRDSWLH